MFFESLESRALLTATLDATTGVLTVTGTASRDRINVYQHSQTQIAVSESTLIPAASPRKKPRVIHKTTLFTLADVKSIVVNAGAGADFVNTGGSERRRLAIVSTIDGAGGNDHLEGGDGNDTVTGAAGRDHIRGRAGDDNLDGGSGNDGIVGGRGADVMAGGDGNDRIDAFDRASTDQVDGGNNDPVSDTNPGDRAIIDEGDSAVNVEKLVTVPPQA